MEKTTRLKVDGWSNSRFARIEGNLVGFEVMSLDCGCSTCFARLSAVENRMQKSGLKWRIVPTQIPEREGGPSLVLMVETPQIPERLDDFFGDLLGLQIREVA